MIILANKNIPKLALKQLSEYGKLILFQTGKITYEAISGHPDIFFCAIDNDLVVAPNTPSALKNEFKTQKINYLEGSERVGFKYPETAKYNCVVTDHFLIGNTELIDKKILEQTKSRDIIHVNQGYTRCNLLPLPQNRFITSDKGIEKALIDKGLDVLYVNPKDIQLPGFDHGFIGGAMGIKANQVFVIGKIKYLDEQEQLLDFLKEFELIELYDGPLFDGGSLIFI